MILRYPCWSCRGKDFWRYKGRQRWHCVVCVPLLDATDVEFASVSDQQRQASRGAHA